MNVFPLSNDPRLAAQMHCDKHVVKMILETSQILCTALHKLNKGFDLPLKATHQNHPWVIWAGDNRANYLWLVKLGYFLSLEFQHRYKHGHMFRPYYDWLGRLHQSFPQADYWTIFPQCMPRDLKSDNPIKAYRNYYIREKAYFAKWTNRPIPTWFNYEGILLD